MKVHAFYNVSGEPALLQDSSGAIMSADPVEEEKQLMPHATGVITLQPSPNGQQPTAATAPPSDIQGDEARQKSIEEFTKMLEPLKARHSALDSLFSTMIFSHFTIVSVSVAIIGVFISHANTERIAVSAFHSFPFRDYVTAFVLCSFLFVGAAALTLIASVIGLRVSSKDVDLSRTLYVDVTDGASYWDVIKRRRLISLGKDEFKQQMMTVSDESKQDKLLDRLYAYEKAVSVKSFVKWLALGFLGLEIIAFVISGIAAILMLLSGH